MLQHPFCYARQLQWYQPIYIIKYNKFFPSLVLNEGVNKLYNYYIFVDEALVENRNNLSFL